MATATNSITEDSPVATWSVVPSLLAVLLAGLVAVFAYRQGLVIPAGLIFLVGASIGASALLPRPHLCFWLTFVLSFFILGIKRYINLPLGVSIDVLLTLTWVSILFSAPKEIKDRINWKNFNNPVFWCSAIWMGYVVLEFFNPAAASRTAWFYAMRGVGLWFLFTAPLAYILLRKQSHLGRFVNIWLGVSIIGSLWAIKQKFIGLDPFEQQWLAAGEDDTHVLFGFLRAFSFYSDAAQFGAAQAHALTMAAILTLSERITFYRRIFYLTAAVFCLVGLALSGMRSPLAIPVVGGIVYILWSKNWLAILLSALVLISTYSFFRYTWIGSNIQEIHRIRVTVRQGTDLPSFEVRERNQSELIDYMLSNPTVLWIGGGIGSVGSFGRRFSPDTFLGQFPPDSWYVRIFAETGLIGLLIHISTLLTLMFIGGYRIWSMNDQLLRQYMLGLYAGLWGVLISSYVNPYYGQIPTALVVYTSYSLLMLSEYYDEKENLEETGVPDPKTIELTGGVHPTYAKRSFRQPQPSKIPNL